MLRARFQKDKNGCWIQQISSKVESAFRFETSALETMDDALEHMKATQSSLNIHHGPLLGINLFDIPDGQVLFMAAHHLVVDIISWTIILDDLEVILSKTGKSSRQIAS